MSDIRFSPNVEGTDLVLGAHIDKQPTFEFSGSYTIEEIKELSRFKDISKITGEG